MGFPGFGITALSLAACIYLIFAAGVQSRLVLAEAFAGAWAVAAFAWAIWSVLIYPRCVSPLRKLPTAGGAHWLFGHGQRFMTPEAEPTREWITTIPHDGLLRYFWFFNTERVLVSSDKGLAEVLVTKSYQFKRPDIVRKLLAPVLGVGILLTEGDVHKAQRRDLMPAFAFRHVKDLYPVFWDKAREVVQAMTSKTDSDGVAQLDALDWANRCTLDIIGVAGLGVDFGSIQDPSNPLAVTYKSIMAEQGGSRILGILHLLFPTWLVKMLPVRRNRVVDNANRVIRGECRHLIRDKKRKMADDKERTDVDILSVALESRRFSDDNLVDQLMTFLAAGHETTASALTWATYLLSCHPAVQTRLRNEIRGNLPPLDDDADMTSADIDSLPYLNAVCNEVLRVFSPVPRTSREAIEDTTIQGQHIPKGTVIMLSPWGTNVDPNLWGTNAMEFKPERWLVDAETDAKRAAGGGGASSNYAFLTFLHGPRSCIGASFAKSEFACLLAAWAGRFEFELRDRDMMDRNKLVVRYGVTARPKGGLHVRARAVPGF
ncbi:hypothetical protein EsDP_00000574 [Epichloe bromicola]|uniref:Cytochrome P450 n=1 Tax=Epichloe bromicola TaxID=79588 RepID=A0ABQ0CF98_9HYPO